MAETKNIKLQLDQLLRILEDLEDSIRKDENLMRKNNSRPKGEEDQIDLEETKSLYELKLNQLIKIKLVKGEINASNGNNKTIYDLSNLNRRKAFLNSLNTFEGKRTTLKSAGKEIEFKAKLSNKKVEKELKEIESGIRLLETELVNFNHSHEVTVDLYTELGLV